MAEVLYFAAKPADEAAAILTAKADAWSNNLESWGLLQRR
jgi:hypothetical protein